MRPVRYRGLALALGLAALSACSQIPGFERPAAPAATEWRNAAAVPGAQPAADWWNAFGNAELARLVAAAQAGNYDLQAATSRIAQAAAQVRSAGAALQPTLDASGRAARDGSFGARPSDRASWRLALDASYEIDFWGRNRAGILSAEAVEAATRFDRETVALTLAADVATTYLQYLALGDRVQTARKNLENARRILDLVETRQRLGATSGLEVAQQRATVAGLEAAVPSLAQQRAETLNALAVLLGESPQAVDAQGDTLAGVALPVVSPGLPSDLLVRRPDIRAAEADLVAANADIGAARAAFFPSIVLTAGTGFASTALTALFDPASSLYSLAAGLTAPIFRGGRLSAELDRARARYDELVATYRGAIVAAFRDVEDALAAAAYQADVQAAQQAVVAETSAAFRLAETQFRAGAVDFLTVLETQRSLFQAEDALLQTRLARLDAAVALYRALGGGWDAGLPSPAPTF